MRIQYEGRTALHAACHSGCGRCVQALRRHSARDLAMNFSWFSSAWDRTFHPWMLTYLAHERASYHHYDAIYEVLPLHVAAIHGCDSCVRALAGSDLEKEMGVGNATRHFEHHETTFRPLFGISNSLYIAFKAILKPLEALTWPF